MLMQKHIHLNLHFATWTLSESADPEKNSATDRFISEVLRHHRDSCHDRYAQPWLFIEPVHVSVNLHCSNIPVIINKHQEGHD